MKLVSLAPLVLLAACAEASITYTEDDPKSSVPLPATALRFALQDSHNMLAKPQAADSAKATAATGVSKSSCPKGTTQEDWAGCFSGVRPDSVMAPADAPQVWVAKPDWKLRSTTKIEGVAAGESDVLNSKVTVTFSDNTDKIIAGAGTGAVAGFGIAGPYGAAVGFVFGAAENTNVPGNMQTWNLNSGLKFSKPPALMIDELAFRRTLCENEVRGQAKLDPAALVTLSPAIAFPLPVAVEHARPFSPVKHTDTPKEACWHKLPNVLPSKRWRNSRNCLYQPTALAQRWPATDGFIGLLSPTTTSRFAH